MNNRRLNFIDRFGRHLLRKDIEKRCGKKCAYCGLSKGMLEMHHITCKHLGGNDDIENMCFLHVGCHDIVHESVKSEIEFEKKMKPN